MRKIFIAGFALVIILMACATGASTDKTLVIWADVNDPENWSGILMTLQNDKQYDGITVSGESELKWRLSSEDDSRSANDSSSLPTSQAGTMAQVATVYEGQEIRIYINGELSSTHSAKNVDLLGKGVRALFLHVSR